MLARRAASPTAAGSGTRAGDRQRVLRARAPGHHGRDARSPSSATSRSKRASASDGQRPPVRRAPRPRRALRREAAGRRGSANVVSSGATMPARAPASIDMLQTVSALVRSTCARIAAPAYSMRVAARPPPAPIVAMMARITSLALDAGRPAAVDRDAHGAAASAATGSAWPARARPRRRRCRRRARRARRGWRCGSRRTRA